MLRRSFLVGSVAALSVSGARAFPVPLSMLAGLKDYSLRHDPRIAAVLVKYNATPGPMLGEFIKAIEWVLPDASDAPAFMRDVMATGLARYAEPDPIREAKLPYVPNDPAIGTATTGEWYADNASGIGGSINLSPTTDPTSAWGRLNAISSGIAYGDSAVKIGDLNGGYTAPALDAIQNLGTGWNGPLGNTNTADVQSPGMGCTSGHGTACAMLMCAAVNNATNIAGVAGGCTFYPYVEVTTSTCAGAVNYADSWTVSCLSAAVSSGVHALSITEAIAAPFGGAGTGATVYAALQTTWNAGIFLCTPSGDLGTPSNPLTFPCTAPATLCVGGVNYQGAVPTLSGFNNSLVLIGPCGDGAGPTSFLQSVRYDGSLFAFGGTSAASPIVCAVAGLVMSANSHLRGNPTAVAEILIASCKRVSGATAWNQTAGFGLVQADKAVQMAIAGAWPNNQGSLIGVQ